MCQYKLFIIHLEVFRVEGIHATSKEAERTIPISLLAALNPLTRVVSSMLLLVCKVAIR